ncbi:MAG TPA: hypothetical protein VIG29_07810 [Vicinamibacteria bacterium]
MDRIYDVPRIRYGPIEGALRLEGGFEVIALPIERAETPPEP